MCRLALVSLHVCQNSQQTMGFHARLDCDSTCLTALVGLGLTSAAANKLRSLHKASAAKAACYSDSRKTQNRSRNGLLSRTLASEPFCGCQGASESERVQAFKKLCSGQFGLRNILVAPIHEVAQLLRFHLQEAEQTGDVNASDVKQQAPSWAL